MRPDARSGRSPTRSSTSTSRVPNRVDARSTWGSIPCSRATRVACWSATSTGKTEATGGPTRTRTSRPAATWTSPRMWRCRVLGSVRTCGRSSALRSGLSQPVRWGWVCCAERSTSEVRWRCLAMIDSSPPKTCSRRMPRAMPGSATSSRSHCTALPAPTEPLCSVTRKPGSHTPTSSATSRGSSGYPPTRLSHSSTPSAWSRRARR
jgi:hypothetical protein